MKRLLFCIYSHNTWGGIESWLHELALGLQARGWDVFLALARGTVFNRPEVAAQAYPGLRIAEIDGRTGTSEGRRRAIIRILAAVQPELIVSIGLGDMFPAVARFKHHGRPVRMVAPVHATNLYTLQDVLTFAPILDGCVTVNPLQQAFLAERSPTLALRCETILNGVHLPTTTPIPAADGALRLAFVGRLNQAHKQVLDLIPFVRELSRRGVNFRLTIVGSGEAEAELQAGLAEFVVRGAVRFTGYLSPKAIRETVWPHQDVLLLFSPSEGCPLVVQEALAQGVVPVCSEFLGVHSLGMPIHSRTGMLFPCGDPAAAADCVAELAANPTRRETLAAAGRRLAKSFLWARSIDRWECLLDKVLQTPIHGLNEAALFAAPAPEPSGRLEHLGCPPGLADRLRRLFRRWPQFQNGWAEWPGSLSVLDDNARAAMLAELHALDQAHKNSSEPLHAAS